jgi:hypothetical protein
MDELLQRALERREQLRNELAAVERFIQSYAPLKERAAVVQHADLFSNLPPKSGRRRGRAKEIASAMDAAEAMILEAGRPLTRSTLLRKLEEAGHEIEGGDKSKVLGTNLWRSKRFYNLAGAGYWPRSVPLPREFHAKERRPSMLLDQEGEG